MILRIKGPDAMRTTLTIDDDVPAAARHLAATITCLLDVDVLIALVDLSPQLI